MRQLMIFLNMIITNLQEQKLMSLKLFTLSQLNKIVQSGEF